MEYDITQIEQSIKGFSTTIKKMDYLIREIEESNKTIQVSLEELRSVKKEKEDLNQAYLEMKRDFDKAIENMSLSNKDMNNTLLGKQKEFIDHFENQITKVFDDVKEIFRLRDIESRKILDDKVKELEGKVSKNQKLSIILFAALIILSLTILVFSLV